MKYKVTGEVTFKFALDVKADSDEDAIDMAVRCAMTGAKPSCAGLEYTGITAVKKLETEVIHETN